MCVLDWGCGWCADTPKEGAKEGAKEGGDGAAGVGASVSGRCVEGTNQRPVYIANTLNSSTCPHYVHLDAKVTSVRSRSCTPSKEAMAVRQ